MKLLITGASGKVGQNFLPQFLEDGRFSDWSVVALCNNRMIPQTERLSVAKGSLADPATIAAAMEDVTHVLHMAAVKESPDTAIDVSVKGMFLMLEEFRRSKTAQQFVLIGGDCSVGHIFHDYGKPITEDAPRKAYPGCYALTKVLEEVMLEQYQIQYGVNGTILRAPWIMEKDDFKCAMSFGDDQFGGPLWSELVSYEEIQANRELGAIPVMRDKNGDSLKRNFVHVDDLVLAILAALDNERAYQQLFNICMNEPVDYLKMANYLAESRGIPMAEISTHFCSNWLDNSKARQALNWSPRNDLHALIDRAWDFKRESNDPRKIWYPG